MSQLTRWLPHRWLHSLLGPRQKNTLPDAAVADEVIDRPTEQVF